MKKVVGQSWVITVQVDSAMFTRACIVPYVKYRSSGLCLIGKSNVAMVHYALDSTGESLMLIGTNWGFPGRSLSR